MRDGKVGRLGPFGLGVGGGGGIKEIAIADRCTINWPATDNKRCALQPLPSLPPRSLPRPGSSSPPLPPT